MRLIFASLIVALTAMSYVLEPASGALFQLGMGRHLFLILGSVWALFESILIVKALSEAKEQILQAKLTQEAARSEAAQARDEILQLRKDLAQLKAVQGDEALQVLALLQEKGRFLDFVMEDVSKYPDGQVGAAARIVQQGCAAFMKEYFDVKPVSEGLEGIMVTLEKDYDQRRYRLMGKVIGEAPFHGKILHRGWLTTQVKLPERVGSGWTDVERKVIAPAEIEIA